MIVTRDVAIVGGGVMGSSTAYWLKRLEPSISVSVVEKDASYARSSTVLSEGNVRVQFNLEENILMSLFALEFLEAFDQDMEVGDWRPHVSGRHQGNLFLVNEEGKEAALEGLALQNRLGCQVEWLDISEIVTRWPAYAGVDLVGGTFGPRDGSFDPTAVLHGYRRKAVSMGVEYIEAEVATIDRSDGTVTGLSTVAEDMIEAPIVLNAAGAWARDLMLHVGIDLPVDPVMRNVFAINTAVDMGELPSVFLPSGAYLISEHERSFNMGWSLPDDVIGYEFNVRRDRFYDVIWPEVIRNFPAFDALEISGTWAGLYAVNTFDGNAIVGEWPDLDGMYVANGFSGHGFQQCHAVGRYLAELMTGRTPTLELARLGPRRLLENAPVFEHPGRII